jgi:alpha-N-arabinofuranosidase
MAYWSEMVESNDFGLDEFMTLCEVVGAEPYVVVSSTGPDDDRMAAEEVEYLNGSSDTPLGELRAANGHPEPYNVKFWGVGNEMWGFMSLEDYIEQHNRIAAAMREIDPTIKIVAVGGVDFEGLQLGRSWAEEMLTYCADHMDLISEHIYGGSSPNLVEHAGSIAQGVRWFVDAHRRYREEFPSLQSKDIRLAFDEWNYSWEDRYEIYGEAGPRYYFKDALGIAQGLHEMIRNSDLVFMANLHAVNVHGQVKTTKTDAAMEATGLAFELYRHHFGVLPVAVRGDFAPLDVVAAWTADHGALTVAIVNPTEFEHKLALTLEGAQLTGSGWLWVISHSDPLAYNEPGLPPRVVIEERQLSEITGELSVPPLSISLYKLPIR